MNPEIASRCEGEPAAAVLAITFTTLFLAMLLAPGIGNVTPVIDCAFLLLLLVPRYSYDAFLEFSSASLTRLSRSVWRLSVFILLEFIVFVLMWTIGRNSSESHPNLTFAILRYTVLIPGLALMPISEWRRFGRLYRAECVAAGIALCTFYPYRIFTFSWPYYSQTLGRFVYGLAHPFVPSLQFVPDVSPMLAGSGIDTTIIFACSGLQAINLFQILFGFMLIMDWKVLNQRRVLTAYVAGLVIALLANAVRITLLVVLGNRISPGVVERYHIHAGWVFFTFIFVVYLLSAYNWLRGPVQEALKYPIPGIMPVIASNDADVAR